MFQSRQERPGLAAVPTEGSTAEEGMAHADRSVSKSRQKINRTLITQIIQIDTD